MLWSDGCSFLRAEGFSCCFCVLYGGLGITKLQFLSKKYPIFSAVIFFSPIFGHQNTGFRTGSGSVSGSALNQCGSTTLLFGTYLVSQTWNYVGRYDNRFRKEIIHDVPWCDTFLPCTGTGTARYGLRFWVIISNLIVLHFFTRSLLWTTLFLRARKVSTTTRKNQP